MELQLKPSQKRMLNHLKTLDDDVDIIQFINREMPIGSGKTIVLTKYIQELKDNEKQCQGLYMQQYGRAYRPILKFAKEKEKTMTVNLKGLEADDIVTFRNGYSLPVTSIKESKFGYMAVIKLMGMDNSNDIWDYDGSSPCGNRERDIVSVEKPEFDWDTAESGMAFEYNDTTVWYVGREWFDGNLAVCAFRKDCSYFNSFSKSDLTRAPEHDIKG